MSLTSFLEYPNLPLSFDSLIFFSQDPVPTSSVIIPSSILPSHAKLTSVTLIPLHYGLIKPLPVVELWAFD